MEQEYEKLKIIAFQIIQNADTLMHSFLADPIDRKMNGGNVSMCIIDANCFIYGRMWGEDSLLRRQTFQTAWRKASQVWITGVPTGKYEELVFSRQIDPEQFGIQKPDFIGWEGGWPVILEDGIRFAIAVSGMRSEKDTELIVKAVEPLGGKIET